MFSFNPSPQARRALVGSQVLTGPRVVPKRRNNQRGGSLEVKPQAPPWGGLQTCFATTTPTSLLVR